MKRDIESKFTALEVRKSEAERARSNILLRLSEIDSFLALREPVEVVFEETGRRMREDALGRYETLLTGLMRDLFPGRSQKIALQLRTLRGAPSLDVYAVSGDGGDRIEDVYDGRGGSVANVLSTGLRLAALVRSRLFPFMALDEPDCWIRPDLAPDFFRLIAQTAETAGIQTLLISHHDSALFDPGIRIVELEKEVDEEGAVIEVRAHDGDPVDWPSERTGIVSIDLENFRTHKKTTFSLSPGVTALVGENDVGKSAVVSALRAVLFGDGNDSCIRHGADSATVRLKVAWNGEIRTLEWTRSRKRGQKETHRLLDASGAVVREQRGGETPEWVREMGFEEPEGLPVQIAHQKTPVFLLDRPGSVRARVLSLGRETVWLDHAQKRFRKAVSEAGAEKKRLHDRLHATQAVLCALKPLSDVRTLFLEAMERWDAAERLRARAAVIEDRIESLTRMAGVDDLSVPEFSPPPALETEMETVARLETLTTALASLATVETLTVPPPPPPPPEIPDIARLEVIVRSLLAAEGIESLSVPALPTLPEVTPALDRIARLANQIEEWRELVREGKAAHEQALEIEQERKRVRSSLAEIENKLGGACPVCGGPLERASAHRGRSEKDGGK